MRKLKNLTVEFISLVKKPATGKTVVLKGDVTGEIFEVVKFDDELKRAYGVVYAPDQVDSQGDYTDSSTIRKAADDFLLSGRAGNVDSRHSFEKVEAFVAESWLIRKDDPMFPTEPDGAWAVGIQVRSDRLWDALKKGEYTGLSLAGKAQAQAEPAKKEDEAPGWFTRFFTRKGTEMEEKDFTELKAEFEALKKEVAGQAELKKQMDALTEQLKKEAEGMDGRIQKSVAEAVSKAKTEQMETINKTLAEALAKGKTESAAGKPNAFAGMI